MNNTHFLFLESFSFSFFFFFTPPQISGNTLCLKIFTYVQHVEHQGLFNYLKFGLFALWFRVNPSEHEFTYNQLYLNIKLQFVIEIVLSHI